MHGNVSEWCLDPWHKNYEGAPKDGSVWDKNILEVVWDKNILDIINVLLRGRGFRIIRGGSWNFDPRYCRSACRYSYFDSDDQDHVGFRLALSVQDS